MTEPNSAPPTAPLANLRWPLIFLAAAFAGWGFYVSGAHYFGWPTFWSVGLAIQGGMVFFAVQAFFPLLNAVAFPLIQLGFGLAGHGFLDWYGYAMGVAALAVYLAAQRKKSA